MNVTQLWYCDICKEMLHFSSRSRHFSSNSHEHKKEYGTVVNENEFNKQVNDEVNYTNIDTIKDCRNKYFQSFQ